MSDASNHKKQEEIALAKKAANEGRILEAKAHLVNAKHEGATEKELYRIRTLITKSSAEQQKHGAWGAFAGFSIAMTAYFITIFMSMGRPLWLSVVLLIVPIVSGYCAGRLKGDVAGPSARFRTGFLSVGFAMALFSFVNMLVVRYRFPAEGQATEIFLLSVSISVVYGIAAGCVAGLVSTLSWRRPGGMNLVDLR